MKRLPEKYDVSRWGRIGEAARQPRLRCSVLCFTGCVIVALIYTYPPGATRWYPRCPFHYLTGLNCPGCGSLRALHALLHGRLTEALCCNPLLVACIPIILAWAVVRVFGALALNRSLELRYPPAVGFSIAVVVILFFVARNIPTYPFSLLSP
jgi:hypothetical protein